MLINFCICFFIFFNSFLLLINYNTVKSALYLISIYVLVAILLFRINLDFFALLFIIVYVGAIVMLFLFVIMLLQFLTYDKIAVNYFILFIEFFILFLMLVLLVSIEYFEFCFDFITIMDSYYTFFSSIELLRFFLVIYLPEYLGFVLFFDFVWVHIFILLGCFLTIVLFFATSITNDYDGIFDVEYNNKLNYYYFNNYFLDIIKNKQFF